MERLEAVRVHAVLPGSGQPLGPSVDPDLQIDLKQACTSPAEMLGVITRVVGMRDRHGDPWASDECLAGLLRALNDIVRPGSTLDGANARLTRRDVRQLMKLRA